MQLTLTTFLTLDGVMQSPGAPDEDRRGGFTHGGWLVPYADDDMGRFIGETIAQADGFLLGRKTYEIFSRHWPQVTDENPVAAALNRLPKHVVSTTIDTPSWANTTVVRGDPIEQITKLKAHQGRELQIHGSGQLARSLMTHNLIDEYRLWIYPVVVGGVGTRLFDDPRPAALQLIDSKTTASGISVLTYQPDGELRQSSFAVAPEPAHHRILR